MADFVLSAISMLLKPCSSVFAEVNTVFVSCLVQKQEPFYHLSEEEG